MSSLETVLDKIRKLRELSKSNNIHEATTAAALADKLIAEHRLSEEQIAEADPSKKENPIEDKYVLYETARVIQWKDRLSDVLASHYGCIIWNDCVYGASEGGRRVSRYRLVGRPSDVEIVRYMFGWLTAEIQRLSVANCKGLGHVAAQSYCSGAVAGIKQQLDATKQEIKKTATVQQTTALVKLDERAKEADIVLRTLHPDLKSSKTYSHRQFDRDAYSKGVSDGKNIHLGKSLGSGTPNLLK